MTAPPLTVTIDYGTALSMTMTGDLVRAAHFDHVSSHFDYADREKAGETQRGEQTLTAQLVHLDRTVRTHEAIKELNLLGLREATLPELLAFALQHPSEYHEFPVVALFMAGSAFIWHDRAGRGLGHQPRDKRWRPNTRFLGVQK
jgi:hypothetical protein